ncbi:MAG: hypothetical protein K5841_09430 [Fretibacterium sp.]|nr:hypothetical protein [Fretibacterium sp.]
MARKKIVFVIVEGPSDEEALGLFFNRIYDKSSVHVHIVHGDLTTMNGNIRNRIADAVREYANSTHLKKTDFQEVIHIVDMDGAYIPDSAVIGDSAAIDPVYNTTEIRTCNPDGIKCRNEQKRKNLDVISSLLFVWGGVPYQAYYMSCNLEHVLYNKLNCTDQEKENNAFAFAKNYKDNVPGFVSFIADSDFSVPGTYLESWTFIKQDKHSLERYTNLGICLRPEKEEAEGEAGSQQKI